MIETVALIVLVVIVVCETALIFKLSSQSTTMLDRAHERTTTYTEGLVDRIISGDYQTYKAYQLMEKAPSVEEEGEPEPPIPIPTLGPDRGGFGSKLGLRALTVRREYDDADRVRATEELLESELPR